MWRNFRLWLLSLITLLVTLLVSGLIWKGYAGIEPPPGTEAIPRPKIQGKFIAMFDTVQEKAAFTIVGKCKDENRYILGPVFLDSFPPDFFDPENLEGSFISTDLVGVPPGCFSASDVIVGYVVDQVKKFPRSHQKPLSSNFCGADNPLTSKGATRKLGDLRPSHFSE